MLNRKLASVVLGLSGFGSLWLAHGYDSRRNPGVPGETNNAPPVSALWNDRGDIASLNLLLGAGGKEHEPTGKFTFVEEDKQGTSPKFVVVDERGTRWKVKLGNEARSETVASRLIWAAGYFTDEHYYLPEMRVENLPKLQRGSDLVLPNGIIRGARLEREIEGVTKIGNWSWFKNPLIGTKEFDGLRIMMALINNWDLKEVNNAIYQVEGEGLRYFISDLGGTFGQAGNEFSRSKDNLGEYSGSKFIQKVTADHVDFFLSTRPFFLTAPYLPHYVARAKMQGVVKDIPLEHARWLGHLLAQLSDEQLRNCFRAAGYAPVEVELAAKLVKQRIEKLNSL